MNAQGNPNACPHSERHAETAVIIRQQVEAERARNQLLREEGRNTQAALTWERDWILKAAPWFQEHAVHFLRKLLRRKDLPQQYRDRINQLLEATP